MESISKIGLMNQMQNLVPAKLLKDKRYIVLNKRGDTIDTIEYLAHANSWSKKKKMSEDIRDAIIYRTRGGAMTAASHNGFTKENVVEVEISFLIK